MNLLFRLTFECHWVPNLCAAPFRKFHLDAFVPFAPSAATIAHLLSPKSGTLVTFCSRYDQDLLVLVHDHKLLVDLLYFPSNG